jgi:hypothetical protein
MTMRFPSRKCETGVNVDTIHTPNREEKCCKDKVEYIDNGTYNEDPKGKEVNYDDINIARRGNSLSRIDTVQHIITPKDPPIKHPIVNLCQNYNESVFFQYDSAPGNNAVIAFNNDKKGRIIKFTYFLDSSAGDAVTVWVDKISANNAKESLLNYVAGGNTFIKGTFNTQKLEFNLNMKILNDEQIQLTIQNASANDVTIMAIADIKYGEEDFD